VSDASTRTAGLDPLRDPRPRIPAWVHDLVCVLVVVGVCFAADPREVYVVPSPLVIGLAVASAAVLLLRRRWPLPVAVVAVAVYVIAVVVDRTQNAGLEIAVAIAVFGVSTRLGRRFGVSVMIGAILVTTASAMIALGTVFDPRITQLVFVLAFAGAAGDATRQHRDYIAALSDRAERAERTREAEARQRVAEERLRIARDLHDAVAHEISVISLNAGVASQTIESDPAQAQESLATVRRAARAVLGEIGELMEMLRSDDAVHPIGEGAIAPQPDIDRLADLFARFDEAGLAVGVRVEGDLSRVPAATGRVVYRLVQEALTNAHKHGGEGRAHVLLVVGDAELEVIVTNPVLGAAEHGEAPEGDGPRPGSGFGLTGLRERVASVRGTVETGLAPGGWRVAARLPIGPLAGEAEG